MNLTPWLPFTDKYWIALPNIIYTVKLIGPSTIMVGSSGGKLWKVTPWCLWERSAVNPCVQHVKGKFTGSAVSSVHGDLLLAVDGFR